MTGRRWTGGRWRIVLVVSFALLVLSAAACGSSNALLGGVSLSIRAEAIALQPGVLSAPAGADVSIDFENADASTPHGLALYHGTDQTPRLVEGEIFVGPATHTLKLGRLLAGRYLLECMVHPNMQTILTIVGPG